MKSHLNIFKMDTKTNRTHQLENDLTSALAISLQEDTLFFHEALKAVFKDSNFYNTLFEALDNEVTVSIEIQKATSQISEFEHVFAISLSENEMADFWSQTNATACDPICDLVISINNILIVIEAKRDNVNCTSQLYNQIVNIFKKQGKELSEVKNQVTPFDLSWTKLMSIAVKAASFEKTTGYQNSFLNDFIQLVKEHNFTWLPESPLVSLKSKNKAAIKRRVTSAVNQFCEDTEYVVKIDFHDRLGFFFSCELTNELLFDVDAETGDLIASIYPGRTKRISDSIFQSDSQFNKEFVINKNIYRVNIDHEISIKIPFYELQKLDQTQNDLSNLVALLSQIHLKFSTQLLLNKNTIHKKMKNTSIVLNKIENEPSYDEEGLKTGFAKFDKFTKGLQPGQLILMAGRPGMGILAFIKCLILNISKRHQNPVAVFSLEQSAKTYLQKMIETEAGISYIEVQRPDHSEETTEKLNKAISKLEKAPIFINDDLEFSFIVISSKIRELKNIQDIKLVIIHGHELVTYKEYGKESRKQELDAIAQELKSLAEELKITIIITHQLSDIWQAHSHKEVLPTLKEIYQDTPISKYADLVTFMYRPEYYGFKTWYHTNESCEGEVDLIIAKNRHGKLHNFRLSFDGYSSKFKEHSSVLLKTK